MALTRDDAMRLDADDPLAAFRDRFVIADEHRLYLDGNSLGRLPKGTRERLHRVDRPVGRASSSAAGTTGSRRRRAPATRSPRCSAPSPAQVLVTDTTTVNLFKLVNAVLDADPSLRTLVTDQDNFPTDRYVLEGIARARGLELNDLRGADPLLGPQPATSPTALIVLSHVAYRSRRARRHGGVRHAHTVIWDLSHSAGAVPVELNERGIRYAVGCTYKYLNAGPGARRLPLRRASRTRCARRSRAGSARTDQFAMERPYAPAPGITRFLAGTPPILVLAAVEEGVRITAEAGIEALREKSIAQTELLIALHDEWLDAARLHARLAARPGTARLARVAAPPRGVADLQRADRARRRHPRLPRPGQRPARHRAALHALRRRLRRDRPAARPGRARRPARSRSAAARAST